MELEGKTAVITGAASPRGLGYAFAEALLKRGVNVVLSDVNLNKGLDSRNTLFTKYGQGRVQFIQCDVTDSQQIQALFERCKDTFGSIDVVVNNAGVADEVNYERMVRINLVGVINGTELALQCMNRESGGRGGLIVNIGSTAGLTPIDFLSIYGGTKAGVVHYSRGAAARTLDTTEQGIRVVCLCPGLTQTDIYKQEHVALIKGTVEIMKVERVVEAFLKLVDDPGNNGGVLAVSPKSMFYRFPKGMKAKL